MKKPSHLDLTIPYMGCSFKMSLQMDYFILTSEFMHERQSIIHIMIRINVIFKSLFKVKKLYKKMYEILIVCFRYSIYTISQSLAA